MTMSEIPADCCLGSMESKATATGGEEAGRTRVESVQCAEEGMLS